MIFFSKAGKEGDGEGKINPEPTYITWVRSVPTQLHTRPYNPPTALQAPGAAAAVRRPGGSAGWHRLQWKVQHSYRYSYKQLWAFYLGWTDFRVFEAQCRYQWVQHHSINSELNPSGFWAASAFTMNISTISTNCTQWNFLKVQLYFGGKKNRLHRLFRGWKSKGKKQQNQTPPTALVRKPHKSSYSATFNSFLFTLNPPQNRYFQKKNPAHIWGNSDTALQSASLKCRSGQRTSCRDTMRSFYT